MHCKHVFLLPLCSTIGKSKLVFCFSLKLLTFKFQISCLLCNLTFLQVQGNRYDFADNLLFIYSFFCQGSNAFPQLSFNLVLPKSHTAYVRQELLCSIVYFVNAFWKAKYHIPLAQVDLTFFICMQFCEKDNMYSV